MEAKNTASEQLKKLDSILDEYERSLGISEFADQFQDDSAKKYMSLSRPQIEKLTPSECAEAALLLGALSFHMQRAYNREVARVNWAKQTLRSTISGREQSYRGSWESQFNQAVNEDSYTRKMLAIQKYAQQRVDRLTYLASSIKNISDIFLAVQRAKVMKNG
tara:strand:- start:1841 stop:2329 length:489 start_codon:yes stop_codon:yes gene_type:complete